MFHIGWNIRTISKRIPPLILSRSFARRRPGGELPIPKREKRLDVVIFGLPNVGKSVLLNCLIERKVAAQHTSGTQHVVRYWVSLNIEIHS